MSSNYKSNIDSTRTALFAPSNPSGKQKTAKAKLAIVRSTAPGVTDRGLTSSVVSTQRSAASKFRTSLTPEQKVAKMNEAEGFRKQAKKAMSSGLFSSPDPVSASTYYKRAADLYKICQEPKLEMLLRISTAELINDRLAAVEYKRAADLAVEVEGYGVEKAAHYNLNAAQIFLESGDTAKAAEATAKAGMVFIDPSTNNTMTGYETECVENLEKAVNLYVPLCLNPRANSASTLETGGDADVLNPGAAEHLVVTSAYGGKNLTQIMFQFILMGEMGSAIYAAGAATFLYEKDSISTISLHRSYLAETVILLAQGDAVAANEAMMRHFQKTSYLRSRECELEENLVRAVQSCDEDALTEVQLSPVLNNLEKCLIDLVLRLRVIGTAKKIEHECGDEENEVDAEATFQEMDDLMADMGLEGDNDEEDDFDLT